MVKWKIYRQSAIDIIGETLVELVEKQFQNTKKEINPGKLGDVLFKNKKIDAASKDLLNEAYSLLKQEEEARTIQAENTEDITTFAEEDEYFPETQDLPKIKKYKLLEVIGQGGMGRVYKGIDPDLGRPVAIKQVLGAKDYQKQRFRREILLTAKLDQEHRVIRARAVDHDDQGNDYFVMDFVEGKELKEYIENIGRGRTYSLENIIEYLAEAIDAISTAHKKKIIHRDIKPDNIMLDRKNIKIMDWGLAKEIDNEEIDSEEEDLKSTDISRSATYPNLTQDGTIMGTPSYMSPEQAMNSKYADQKSDIYSFGAILYQILTGESPNKTNIKLKKNEELDVRKILINLIDLDKPALLPSKIAKNVPPELESICMKALAKDTKERYQTAEEFRDDLRAYLRGGIVKAHKYSAWKKTQMLIQKHPTYALGAFLGIMMLAGGGIGLQALNSANLKAETAEIQKELAKEKAEKEKQAKIIAEIRAKTAETELKGQSQSLNKLQSLEHLTQNENYYSAALQIINTAIQESPQFWKPYLVRAKHLGEYGKHEKADQDFQKAQELFMQQHKKESTEIWFEAGMYYGLPIEIGGRGLENRALEYFEKAAKAKAGVFSDLAETVALVIKAKQDILQVDDYLPDAIQLSEKLTQNPIAINIAATWRARAFIYGMSDFYGYDKYAFKKYADFNTAKDALLKVITKHTGPPALRNFLASVYEHIQPEISIEIYSTLIEETDNPKYYNNRGLLYVRQRKSLLALEDFNSAIARNPKEALFYNNRAIAHRLNAEFNLAIQDLNTAIQLNPDLARAFYQRAEIYYAMQNTSQASEDLEKTIECEPDYAEALNLRGVINQEKGRERQAILDYKSAIKANPDYSEAYCNLGILQYHQNNYIQAEQNFKQALAIDPTHWQSLTNLAAVYFQQEKYSDSLIFFEKALKYSPESQQEMIRNNISTVQNKIKEK